MEYCGVLFFYKGEIPCNHEIMRDALSLIQRLPVMKTDLFKEDFYNVSLCPTHGGCTNGNNFYINLILYSPPSPDILESLHLRCDDKYNQLPLPP